MRIGGEAGGTGPADQSPLRPGRVLYWLYAGRLAVALGVYGTALLLGDFWLSGGAVLLDPQVRRVAWAGLVLTAVVTPVSYWRTHLRGTESPSLAFLYGQALVDIALVTGIVHITGGSQGVFPPLLYVALVSGYALLLPVGSAVVVALATGLAYLADIAVAYPDLFDVTVLIQVGIFTTVAIVSSLIAARLRQVNRQLRTVERELRRLQIGTDDILRTIEAGVVTLDETGRVAYLNRAAEQLLGLQEGTWPGRDLLAELERRVPDAARAVRSSLETGRPARSREVDIPLPGGERRPVVVHTASHVRPGAPSSVTLVFQDLRLTRQLENLRLRAGKLEAVAELSASLAHEIKNPLASIRSSVEQLSGGTLETDDAETLRRLIVREVDRLSRLLEQFNDFARVGVGERRPLEVERLVREAVEVVRQRQEVADGRARIDVRVEGELDDLWGDPDLIHRTLVNLLLNAVQVGAASGSVKIRVVADELRPEEAPPEIVAGAPVRIRVIDDGPGIDPEEIDRIFEPFYTKRKGGSGMGLAIAHRAVQAHGGALLASSEPGRGATFTVVLPRRVRETEALQGTGESERASVDGGR